MPHYDRLENQSSKSVPNKPKVDLERMEDVAEGRLQSAKIFADLCPKRMIFDATQGNETKIGRIDSKRERAKKIEDKIAIFEKKLD